jgi:geranylgeranyl diphosphate synthase type I
MIDSDMLPAYFDSIRARIIPALHRFLNAKKEDLARVNALGADAVQRLLDFTLRGKMVRGCLVHMGWSICSTTARTSADQETAVTDVGAAMELFQSGLLVHDDIMDRDPVRRGKPSLYQQYADVAARDGHADALHAGHALGICAGDVAYFMAFELLAAAKTDSGVLARLLTLCARELSAVGIAQMQDVAWSGGALIVDVADILRMYTYKTGRYSFSLPLLAGALLAGAPAEQRARLETFGESVGLLFQIRDDELGLFGDEGELGKPVGSDVREGKKTIIFASLMAAADPAQRGRLESIFGNPGATEADIEYARAVASSPRVRTKIAAVTADLTEKAQAALGAITSGSEEDRAAMKGLLDFTSARRQ